MINKHRSGFTFIDLFAGIGGFHYAMHSLGGTCVFASEKDKFARETYKTNFINISPELFEKPEYYNSDITQVDSDSIPAFDMLCAGFPCQPFSLAGSKLGFNDIRGTLFFDIARIIRHKKERDVAPKVLLLENVKHFKDHDKGNTIKVVKHVIENELGYYFKYAVLNSRDFGLPQNRERVFMVAWLPELASDFCFPTTASPRNTRVSDILENYVDERYTLTDHQWDYHQQRKLDQIAKGNGFGYSLFSPDSPYTSTISARYYKDGSEIFIHQDGKNPRRLTPREAANLQGFPAEPEFTIPVSHLQAYKQFGNAVSVPVVKAVGLEIKKQLLKCQTIAAKGHNNGEHGERGD